MSNGKKLSEKLNIRTPFFLVLTKEFLSDLKIPFPFTASIGNTEKRQEKPHVNTKHTIEAIDEITSTSIGIAPSSIKNSPSATGSEAAKNGKTTINSDIKNVTTDFIKHFSEVKAQKSSESSQRLRSFIRLTICNNPYANGAVSSTSRTIKATL